MYVWLSLFLPCSLPHVAHLFCAGHVWFSLFLPSLLCAWPIYSVCTAHVCVAFLVLAMFFAICGTFILCRTCVAFLVLALFFTTCKWSSWGSIIFLTFCLKKKKFLKSEQPVFFRVSDLIWNFQKSCVHAFGRKIYECKQTGQTMRTALIEATLAGKIECVEALTAREAGIHWLYLLSGEPFVVLRASGAQCHGLQCPWDGRSSQLLLQQVLRRYFRPFVRTVHLM